MSDNNSYVPLRASFESIARVGGVTPQWRIGRGGRVAHLMVTDNTIFYTACGQEWSSLRRWSPTDDAKIRYCGACEWAEAKLKARAKEAAK